MHAVRSSRLTDHDNPALSEFDVDAIRTPDLELDLGILPEIGPLAGRDWFHESHSLRFER